MCPCDCVRVVIRRFRRMYATCRQQTSPRTRTRRCERCQRGQDCANIHSFMSCAEGHCSQPGCARQTRRQSGGRRSERSILVSMPACTHSCALMPTPCTGGGGRGNQHPSLVTCDASDPAQQWVSEVTQWVSEVTQWWVRLPSGECSYPGGAYLWHQYDQSEGPAASGQRGCTDGMHTWQNKVNGCPCQTHWWGLCSILFRLVLTPQSERDPQTCHSRLLYVLNLTANYLELPKATKMLLNSDNCGSGLILYPWVTGGCHNNQVSNASTNHNLRSQSDFAPCVTHTILPTPARYPCAKQHTKGFLLWDVEWRFQVCRLVSTSSASRNS